MFNMKAIYNAFDADEPLPAGDTERYVDLTHVRGGLKIAERMAPRIQNTREHESHHLLMGHTKCGKTTELNRTRKMLDDDGYETVFFDVADFGGTRTFEYTTVLLLLAEQVVIQLAKRGIKVDTERIKKLDEFLREKEVTTGREVSGEAVAKGEAELGSGLLASFLGKLGFGLEFTGGYQRSREITVRIEADMSGFLNNIRRLIADARDKVLMAPNGKGLAIVCDGCDKLAINATDGSGKTHDLQQSLFVDHANDLRSIPCHVIYTVPLSISVNLGDVWEHSPAFVPAIPVHVMPGIESVEAGNGRAALREVTERRLKQHGATINGLFAIPASFDKLLDASGGHISDLLLMVREAIIEAQMDNAERIEEVHLNRSIRLRSLEYTRLIESSYLDTLAEIERYKKSLSNSGVYREIIAKRLALEYVCGEENCVDLHPLAAISSAFRQHKERVEKR